MPCENEAWVNCWGARRLKRVQLIQPDITVSTLAGTRQGCQTSGSEDGKDDRIKIEFFKQKKMKCWQET